MKTAKRFLVVLLTFCLLCSTVMPVFAEEAVTPEATQEIAEETAEETTDETSYAEETPIEEISSEEAAGEESSAEEATKEESSTEEATEEEPSAEEATEEEPSAKPIAGKASFSVAKSSTSVFSTASGALGSLNWSISGSTLTINGSGAMTSYYSASYYPWHSYRSSITKLVIGDYVTSIGNDAFRDMGNLTSLTIGSRVTSIGNYAFKNCSNLTTVTIPAAVTVIGENAFTDCTNLAALEFVSNSKLTDINYQAFYNCKNLRTLELPNSLVTIGSRAFLNCTNLLAVEFGTKLTTIKSKAFENCSNLIEVDIPANVRTIDYDAFANCTSMVSLNLSYGLQTIGSNAFGDCTKLAGTVKIPGTVTSWASSTFDGCTALEGAQIYSACNIPDYAFKNCASLSSVTIGGTVTGIGYQSFYNCSKLTSVSIPASVKTIGSYAFQGCTALKTATLTSGLTSISSYAFRGNIALTSIKIPNSVTSLGDYAFAGCTALQTATVSTGVTRIEGSTFSGCTSLTTVTLGNNVNSIDGYAFENCTSLKSINWPSNLNSIGYKSFYNCDSLTIIVFPEALNSIDGYAFRDCNSLSSVTLDRNVTKISYNAFDYCPALTKFTTHSTTTTYGSNVFYGGSSSLTIYGYADSTANTYATNNNHKFVAITSLDTPTNKKIANTVSGVHVYWNYVPGASYYTVYRSTSPNGTYSVAKSVCAATNWTDTSVTSGSTYYYKVEAKNSSASSSKSAYQSITYIGTPDITSRINKAAGIQLGWNRISGATGYAIYRKPYSGAGSDTWVRVATITDGSTVSWTDTSVKNNNGTTYRYTIRALYGSTLSGCRNTGRTMVRLCSQVLNSATKASSTSIKCNWTTSSAVTGYEVRFMIGDTVYKTVTIGNYNTGTKTFTGLIPGKTYKIQVRTYKKVNGVGSFYSAWSTAKTVSL